MKTVVRTIDGKEFDNRSAAAEHEEAVLDTMTDRLNVPIWDILEVLEQKSTKGKDEYYGTAAGVFRELIHKYLLLSNTTPQSLGL